MAQKANKKEIGLFNSISFAVGAMVGGGVFVLSGLALKQTGPSAIISFVLAGIMVLISALSFAVIASCKNSKYSVYGIVGEALGSEIWSFLTSWSFYLAGIIGAAFVLSAFGTYLSQFFLKGTSYLIWAILGGIFLTLINLGPASIIARLESLLVSIKVLILFVLIYFGLKAFRLSQIHPFLPHGANQVLVTSAFLFIAFLGFNVITNISSEIKNPTKTIPKAIIYSMLIVTIIYAGVVIALVAAKISTYSEASVGVAAQNLIGPVGGTLIIVGALISTLSSANANILGSSEIMIRMALDKQVPTKLAKIKHGHPYYSVIAGAIFYFILILSNKTASVISLANITAIVALIIVNLAAIRIIKDKHYQAIKLPLGVLLPIIGAITAISQFFFMKSSNLLLGFILVGLGLIVYGLRNKLHHLKTYSELKKLYSEIKGPLFRSFFSK